MVKSPPAWACKHCRARRVTRSGIESHVRSEHPYAYQRFIDDGTSPAPYRPLPEGDR